MSNGVPSPPAQAWMNGTCAILTTMTRRSPRFDLLGGTVKTPESIKITQTILANSWGVNDAASLRSTLTGLRDHGDRTGYAPNPNDGLGPRGLLAWDYVRLIAVAGWGFAADYVPEAEAWSFIWPAAVHLKQAYASWDELGQAYVKGVFAWDQGAGADAEQRFQRLIQEPDSPWRTVPWNVDLAAPSPVNLAAGTLSVGGQQLGVRVDGLTPGNYLKARASSMIWGWIIGAFILFVMAIVAGGVGFYVYRESKKTGVGAAPAVSVAAKWDGKSTFECGANDAVTLTGITASVSGTAIKASCNCQLTLSGVSITAGVGIDASANAKVTMTGGSLTASTSSVVAAGNAHVTFTGTKVSGKSKTSGLAKVTGAN
jgi:Protein of unknown function (DUF1266)